MWGEGGVLASRIAVLSVFFQWRHVPVIHEMLAAVGSSDMTHHELTWAPMLGAFKIFLAERDRVLCWPPKTSFMTAATDSRAVPVLELLFSDALAKFLHAVADGAEHDKRADAEAGACEHASKRCSDLIMRAQDIWQLKSECVYRH